MKTLQNLILPEKNKQTNNTEKMQLSIRTTQRLGFSLGTVPEGNSFETSLKYPLSYNWVLIHKTAKQFKCLEKKKGCPRVYEVISLFLIINYES